MARNIAYICDWLNLVIWQCSVRLRACASVCFECLHPVGSIILCSFPFAPTCFLNRLLITFRQPQPKLFEVNRRGACQAHASLSVDWSLDRETRVCFQHREVWRVLCSPEINKCSFLVFLGQAGFITANCFWNIAVFLEMLECRFPSQSWTWNALFSEYAFFFFPLPPPWILYLFCLWIPE